MIGETILKWRLSNAVTYNIAEIEVISFSKARSQHAKEEIAASRLVFGEQGVKLNDNATRWLGVWPDSKLTFDIYIKEQIQLAKTTEARIKGLSKTDGLPPGLVGKIEISTVQALTFFEMRIG